MTTPDHERFEDNVAAYVLGALPDLEAQHFQGHLRGCGLCQEEALRLRTAVEALPRSVEQVEPPASLKRSLMQTVRAEAAPAPERTRPRRRFSLSWPQLRAPAFAAAALIVGLLLGGGLASLGDEDATARTIEAEVDRARLAGAHGNLVVPADDARSAILRMQDLPPAGDGRVYEVWISEDGRVRPASLFVPHNDGSAVAGVEIDAGEADAVLVTREQSGGVARPSEDPVIAIPL